MKFPEEYLNCFACGPNNTRGLKLTFDYNNEKQLLESRMILPSDLEGWPGVIHGGIVTTVLDECAYYTILQSGDKWSTGVTTNINLDFKAPTPANEPLLAQAWIEKNRRNLLYCQARLFIEKDMTLLAKAEITYLMKKAVHA